MIGGGSGVVIVNRYRQPEWSATADHTGAFRIAIWRHNLQESFFVTRCCCQRFVGLLLLLFMFGCATAVEEAATPPTKSPLSSSVEMADGVTSQPHLSPSPSLAETKATSVPDTINLAIVAELRNAIQLEVCRLDCASYTPFLTVSDAKLIASLVKSLDTDIPLKPHARCPAVYQLCFTLDYGQHYCFGYTCEMMTPAFLRGNQEFWHGRDAIAPDAFNELMMSLIAP
jgi:hypothetical protein